jgi:pimeloyl-ACP methyl ester carboxylesterase
MAGRATFVLVHGAWMGGYGWTAFADQLRGHGHRVLTPTLSGMGEGAHPIGTAIDLDTHIEDVLRVLRRERLNRVVLTGHSYGGMAVTGLVDRMPEAIKALVYIDAFVPSDGQSLLDLAGPEFAAWCLAATADGPSGLGVAPPDWLCQSLSPADRALLRPQPLATFAQHLRLRAANAGGHGRMYVLAGRNKGFQGFYERARRDGWRTAEVDCGHMVYLERPRDLLALLDDMAG